MIFTRILVAASLVTMLSTAAFAQAAAPATAPAAPAMAPAAAAAPMDKMAISKACSSEADTQKLKGKARKSFRSKCKMQKMKGM